MDVWDKWTETSMDAQDHLFRRVDADGNYLPHQAIYGFASYRVLQYCEAYLLLSLLDRLHFDSFIDVGCAEGFYPRLVSARYGAEVYGVDLSASGIRRMRDYHRIEGVCADAHALPIKDRAFDVVLCSNTIEHVSSTKQVISELMRIARKYVLVGIPQALTQKEIDSFRPDLGAQRDQHVHIFTTKTFSQILPVDYPVTIYYANSFLILILNAVYKRTIGRIAHCLTLVKMMIYADKLGCRLTPRKSIHMLGKIDLTGKEAILPQAEKSHKPGSIADFILKGIYELNRKELGSTVLNLGTENTSQWREFTVKTCEQNCPVDTTVSEKILKFLACPRCKKDVIFQDETVLCQNCGVSYHVEDGIPIMYNLGH